MRLVASVLYEDRRSLQKGFGLHDLVVACVADLLHKSPWREIEKEFEAVPLKGNGNVLRAVRDETEWRTRGRALVAFVDRDQVKRLSKDADGRLDHESCGRVLAEQFRNGKPATVVLLDGNVETIVRAAGEALKRPEGKIEEAVKTKDRTLRDSILIEAADASDPGVRQAILGQVPSLQRLVRILAKLAEQVPGE